MLFLFVGPFSSLRSFEVLLAGLRSFEVLFLFVGPFSRSEII